MKFVDYAFMGIMSFFLLIGLIFSSIPTDYKLHVDEEIGVVFVTHVNRGRKGYDNNEIKFSTGEILFVPKSEDFRSALKENRVLVMVNQSDSEKSQEIINQLVDKKYLDPQDYNLIILPFDLDLKEIEYIIINYDESRKHISDSKTKIKRYDLDLVPLID